MLIQMVTWVVFYENIHSFYLSDHRQLIICMRNSSGRHKKILYPKGSPGIETAVGIRTLMAVWMIFISDPLQNLCRFIFNFKTRLQVIQYFILNSSLGFRVFAQWKKKESCKREFLTAAIDLPAAIIEVFGNVFFCDFREMKSLEIFKEFSEWFVGGISGLEKISITF